MKTKAEISNDYNKKNTTTILVRLNFKTDRDIIEKLDSEANKSGYIKGLIREDIRKGENTMKKYEIIKTSIEVANEKEIHEGQTTEEAVDLNTIESFSSLQEAKKAFSKYHTEVANMGRYKLFSEYSLVLMPYDEDGESDFTNMDELAITSLPVEFTNKYKNIYSDMEYEAENYDLDLLDDEVQEVLDRFTKKEIEGTFEQSELEKELEKLA